MKMQQMLFVLRWQFRLDNYGTMGNWPSHETNLNLQPILVAISLSCLRHNILHKNIDKTQNCRHCSKKIRDTPVPLRRVKTTRSPTHSHPFQVTLPNPQTLSHKSSFIPRTCNLWNVLPSCFPESYNLPSFKSKINKLDLISLSS